MKHRKFPRWGWIEIGKLSGVNITLALMFSICLLLLLDSWKVARVIFGLLYHASHCHPTTCSSHLNLLITGLEKHNPVYTVLSDTIFFSIRLISVPYQPFSIFWCWFSSLCVFGLLFQWLLLLKQQFCHVAHLLVFWKCWGTGSCLNCNSKAKIFITSALQSPPSGSHMSGISMVVSVTDSCQALRALQCLQLSPLLGRDIKDMAKARM